MASKALSHQCDFRGRIDSASGAEEGGSWWGVGGCAVLLEGRPAFLVNASTVVVV